MTTEKLALDPRVPEPVAALLCGRAGDWLLQQLPRVSAEREALLAKRVERQAGFDAGTLPAFSRDDDDWTCPEPPAGLRGRRVDLHAAPAPASLEAAASGLASALVVDLEDALPALGAALGMLNTLVNHLDGNAGAVPLVIGPRELAATEPLVTWQGKPVPAGLLDTAVAIGGIGPHLARSGLPLSLRLSRLESADEGRYWAGILDAAKPEVPAICCDIAIETVSAACTADDLLAVLRPYAAALCLDRHACLLSFVRSFRQHPQRILPDADELSSTAHFLHSWAQRVIRTAHRRQVLAIGPCASYVASGGEDDEAVLARLRSDKERHVRDGFDGSGVADRGLLGVARAAFDGLMSGQHQMHRMLRDVHITRDDLLQVSRGKITAYGMQAAIAVALLSDDACRRGEAGLTWRGHRWTSAAAETAAWHLRQCVQQVTGVLDDGRAVDGHLFDTLLAQAAQDVAEPGRDLGDAAARLQSFVAGTGTERWLAPEGVGA